MSEQVTIIMPVYNPGKYLRSCLDSLLAQTMDDFRIIAIDDGSTDNSWDVLQEYAAQDARLLPQQNPYNIGAARTRNIGLQLARGEYVVILDADDYFEPDYLECMWTACKENDLDIAICDYWQRDESTGKEQKNFINRNFLNIVDRPFYWQDIKKYVLMIFPHNPFTRMYRKTFLDEFDLNFQDLSNANDLYFAELSLICAHRIQHISKPLVHYRYNTGNQISTFRSKKAECICLAFIKLNQILHRINVYDEVKETFISHSIESIYAYINILDSKDRVCFLQYLQNEFYPRINFVNLACDSFISDYIYQKWRGMNSSDNNCELFKDSVFKENTYKSFFDEVKNRKIKIAHWGYGILGQEFIEVSKRLNCPVLECYDSDSIRWNYCLDIPVKSFRDRDVSISLIVVTNSTFIDDILKVTRNYRLPLFDFESFLKYGICFSECLLK